MFVFKSLHENGIFLAAGFFFIVYLRLS